MLKCPRCGNTYTGKYAFCPIDAEALKPVSEGGKPVREPAVVRVRTILYSFLSLVLAGVLAFAGFFFYQYLKPKYGGLIVKTTPPGAAVFVNNEQRGVSPLTVGALLAGGYRVRAVKEGYRESVQQIEVLPYSTESVHIKLEPTVAQLSNEQLAEVEALRKRLDTAQKEGILLPPPEDYNALYFADRILAIDPANAYAAEVKARLAETVRASADLAYAREDWLEAENQYRNLARILPNDISINERLTDISGRIEASVKDREKQVGDWTSRAEAAFRAGSLVPPDKDNALEALRNIQRLDRKSAYARDGMVRVREMMQSRADGKFAGGDLAGARNDFRTVLEFFPDDAYSKSRIAAAEAKIAEAAQAEQQRLLKMQEEQRFRQQVTALKASALASHRSGNWQKSITEWQEYLKFEANTDEAYFYIAAAQAELRQYDTAILNYGKAVALNPSNAAAHLNAGILYDRHRGDLKNSEIHLRRAKELGGAATYTPERIQAMIQDLQSRAQTSVLRKTPFAVEHKHAFSACRGTMRLTEDGVDYRTTETDHTFFEPYNALRSLTVVGAEISIRTRTNKKYNFVLIAGPDEAPKVRMLAAPHVPSETR